MSTLLDAQIDTALHRSPNSRFASLQFQAQAGRVILSGFVPSWFHKQMAQEAVRTVEGIIEIQNELRVLSGSEQTGPASAGPGTERRNRFE